MVELIRGLRQGIHLRQRRFHIISASQKFPNYGNSQKLTWAGMQTGPAVDIGRYDKIRRAISLCGGAQTRRTFLGDTDRAGDALLAYRVLRDGNEILGETLDIHSGGVRSDISHHENEIAQSEAATGKPFSLYCCMPSNLLVDQAKCPSRMGNFATLRELFAHAAQAVSVDFCWLPVPYRRQLNFTSEVAGSGQFGGGACRTFAARIRSGKFPEEHPRRSPNALLNRREDFDSGLADDLIPRRRWRQFSIWWRDVNTAMDRG